MPHTLEGFQTGGSGEQCGAGRMVVALMCGVFFGILASFWAYLVVSYKIGANPGLGTGGYNMLRSWLYYPTETNIPAVGFMGGRIPVHGITVVVANPFSDVSISSYRLCSGE